MAKSDNKAMGMYIYTFVCTLLFFLLTSFNAQASECNMSRSCVDLGYTTNRADCPISIVLACPFDTSKVRCPDCSDYPLTKLDVDTEIGLVLSCPYDGTSFKYTSCPIGYTLADGNCTCNIADYPHSNSITGCNRLYSCKSNGTTKYRCEGCAPGYTLQSGSCILADPCEGYYSSLPENCLMVSTCPKNSSKVKCMGCQTGYELDVDNHACIPTFPYGFLAVEVTVNAGDSFGYRILGAFTIDWGDGTSESFNTGHLTVESLQVSELTEVMHQYTSAGTYTVIVGGTETSLRLQSPGNSKYTKLITKLVNLNLSTVQDYGMLFWNAWNMVGSTNNIQLPSGLTNGSNMFYGCSKLTGNIPTLPSSLTDGGYMFSECTGLTGNIPELPSGLQYGSNMFYGCTGLTGTCPTKPNGLNGLNCGYMFEGTNVTCDYCGDGLI